ncbi:hypothetical protein BGZ58_007470 [Dissophora ornata]|nr:hypothetical protein BGZ58_007470 [Dissophora ornata]
MPSDKDVYDQIQDSWRANVAASSEEPHDVIILDQDMKAGDEAYGRSATAAWTLLNVLERGIGSDCFGGAPIRLWYLEGGFAAFQSWDFSEKYLMRSGFLKSSTSSPDLSPMQQDDQDVEMTTAAPAESSAPLPNHGKPVRRESLFSLNTKALQRPAGVNRAQTVNLKLAIPSVNCNSQQQQQQQQHQQQQQQQQQSKGSWLTVPSSMAAAATSPTMSIVSNHSMEITHSASTDHSSSWSADSNSVNGSGHFPLSVPAGSMTLGAKRSASSLLTINSTQASSTSISIQEECEDQSEPRSGSRSLRVSCSIQQWDNDSYKGDLSRSPSGSFQNMCSNQYYEDTCHPLNDRSSNFDSAEQDEIHDDSEDKISCILPNFLYLGPEIVHQSQVEELDRLGVKRILNMATECEDLLVSNRQGMEYHKIGVYDHIDADVSAGLQEAVDIIAASSDSPIYVHCKAGKSRSVTATIAYLITQLQWPLNKAYKHVLTQRPCMCPNIGFVSELIRMEERTFGADKARGIYVA